MSGAQSKFVWFLEFYISGSTHPRKVVSWQAETSRGMILEKSKI